MGFNDAAFTSAVSSYIVQPRFIVKMARAHVVWPAAAAGSCARFTPVAKVVSTSGTTAGMQERVAHELFARVSNRRAAGSGEAKAMAAVQRFAACKAEASDAAETAVAAAATTGAVIVEVGWATSVDDWREYAGGAEHRAPSRGCQSRRVSRWGTLRNRLRCLWRVSLRDGGAPRAVARACAGEGGWRRERSGR